jgi:hypothetical protein
VQLTRKQGSVPAYLVDALRPFPWDRRHRHAAAVEVPLGQKVDVRPWHRLAVRVQPVRLADADVHSVAWHPLAWRPGRAPARRRSPR